METGWVFNIQKYSIHDGPGIRTTVFLKGCPLSCVWCHNPESQAPGPEILVVESRCLVCGECRHACPFGEVLPGGPVLPTRNEPCTTCGACVSACPTGARQFAGKRLSVAEVMAEVQSDRVFHEESAGGVTFSGGEPLTQPAFLRELLLACRKQGIPTAVDTCGFARTDHLLEIAALANLFLYDLKLMDERKHQQFCGVPVAPILANLSALASVHSRIWVRVPVIPGINDSPEDLLPLARFVLQFPAVRQVNLLPYHNTAEAKFHRLGRAYALQGLKSPTTERMREIQGLMAEAGLNAHIGG